MPFSRFLTVLMTCLILVGCASGSLAQPPSHQLRAPIDRAYVKGPYGQMHIRRMQPAAADITHPPLILFHPTPFSGTFFEPFMRRLASDRLVIAIDTPGYGHSDSPPEPQSIEAYAAAAITALEELGLGDSQYDVLGYHTGGLIAVETAMQTDGNVRRLVLPGVPFYVGEKRKEAHQLYAKPSPLSRDGGHLLKKWDFAALAADDGMMLEQVQANFNDMIQSFPNDWWAYHGVFTYASDIQFPKIRQPALFIATAGSLTAETKAASELMNDSTFVMMPDVKHGLFAIHLDKIEAATRNFLDTKTN